MGRAFSVLLFCVAMDPWYHHVHRIPRVLITRGYMDDNATGGTGLQWLAPAERLITSFASAGFLVLTHSCYKTEILSSFPNYTPLISPCPSVLDGFPSLPSPLPDTWLKLMCGSRSVTIHSSLLSVSPAGVTCPTHPHLLSLLHTAPCSCKCKTFLLPNFTLSPEDLVLLDSSPFGAKIVASHATMLGLFLHSPTKQVTPLYDDQGILLPPRPLYSLPEIEASQVRKALATMEHRAQAVSSLALSFRERTLFLSFYVLSIPLYVHSTLLPTATLLNHYTKILRKVLCPRPWIKAAFLPGVVSFLKLGVLHCPHISIFSSLLGYSLRCYGEMVLSWLCFISPTLPAMPGQLATGLAHTRQALLQANPYSVSSFIELFQKHLYPGLPSHKLARKITILLKSHLKKRLLTDARAFLRLRLSQVPWLFSSSSSLLDTRHVTPLKIIPSFLRLAILRWVIDSEPDLHFRLRPYLSRSAPCLCGCGLYSSLYPFGILRGAYHSSHPTYDLLYTLHLSQDQDDPLATMSVKRHPPLPPAVHPPKWQKLDHTLVDTLDFLPPPFIAGVPCPASCAARGITLFSTGSTFVRSLPRQGVSVVPGKLSTGFFLNPPPPPLVPLLVVYGALHDNSCMNGPVFLCPHFVPDTHS